ncbi:MAG: DUF5662 family protein [Candidatus Hodarchaeales archaeon]
MNDKYDSKEDTISHIKMVRFLLKGFAESILARGVIHDSSKLEDPEKSLFDEFTPKLRSVEYGSEKYNEYLEQMGTALNHHYENNRHHPEHFEWGIGNMNLLDIVEMFCDWKAASLRHDDGDMKNSLEINRERFDMTDQLYNIFMNTINDFRW